MATSLYTAQSVIQTCEQHHPQELSYFCKPCIKFICTTCVKTDHTHHDWDLISSFAKQLRIETPGKCKDIRGQLHVFQEELTLIKNRKATSEERQQKHLERLEDTRIAIIDAVNKIVDKKKQNIIEFAREECESLKKKETKVTEMLEYIEKMTKSLDTNINAYSDYDVIEMEQGMLTMFEKLKKDRIDTDVSSEAYVPGEMDTDALDRIVGGMKLKETFLVKSSEPRLCHLVRRQHFSGFGFSFVSAKT